MNSFFHFFHSSFPHLLASLWFDMIHLFIVSVKREGGDFFCKVCIGFFFCFFFFYERCNISTVERGSRGVFCVYLSKEGRDGGRSLF
ncbi:MAG: hypothetical protein J3R72DRAFT_118414 [Linnemannia gamsii]|nr:MAG: hypothetical protein J3R72DRAFT_118414 [Linnemannia gamsii]